MEKSNKRSAKAIALFTALLLVLSLAIPFGFASAVGEETDPENPVNETESVDATEAPSESASMQESAEIDRDVIVPEVIGSEEATEQGSVQGSADEQTYTLTLKYFEIVTYDDFEPGTDFDSPGLILIKQEQIGGFHEGDTVDTWDYVQDFEGYFFFDAYPARLVISSDNSKNVIELTYGKYWNSSYNVNYYAMLNADLGTDSWSEAIQPDTEFLKMGSLTKTNQRFGKVIKGSEYEYPLAGLEVVGSFPDEITLSNGSDNDINLLYVPEADIVPPNDDVVGDIVGGITGGGSSSGSDSGVNVPSQDQVSTSVQSQVTSSIKDNSITRKGVEVNEFIDTSNGRYILGQKMTPPAPTEANEGLSSFLSEYMNTNSGYNHLLNAINSMNISLLIVLFLLFAFFVITLYVFHREEEKEKALRA